MAERKQVVHYCVKCGKGMKYRDKKMLYMYDIKHMSFNKLYPENDKPIKRFAINLCEKCADELEKLIEEWKDEQGKEVDVE